MALEVVSLGDDASLDCSLVGAKAARLAAALRLGFPVLPGVVVPVAASLPALAAASRSVAAGGVHAARLAVIEGDIADSVHLSRRVALLGDSLAVRSSSPLEGSARYAGVFASYLGISPDEITTAVKGVWASALLPPDPDGGPMSEGAGPAGIGVLVQPEILPTVSGTARVQDLDVSVVVVKGSPAPLLSGWAAGHAALVHVDRNLGVRVAGDDALALAGEGTLAAVSCLAVRVRDELGDDLIEWALFDDGIVLLQATKSADPSSEQSSLAADDIVTHAEAAAVCRLGYEFAGPLGETLVLPVVLAGVTGRSRPRAARTSEAAAGMSAAFAWARAQALARRLQDALWQHAQHDPASTLAQLRGGDVAETVERLAGLPAAAADQVTELLSHLDIVADHLVGAGLLRARDDLWGAPVDAVASLLAGEVDRVCDPSTVSRDNRRRAQRRWEPVVHAIVGATGTLVRGQATVAGVAAGRAVFVAGLPTAVVNTPRMVLIAPAPIPQLAQLLWGASALVTFGGSNAAHLVEVARSLSIPTVLGCAAEELLPALRAGGPGVLVAVDGDRGTVAVDVGPATEAGRA